MNFDENIIQLSYEVHNVIGRPISPLAVVAFLESKGYNNQLAKEEYGFDSLNELGTQIFDHLVELPITDEDYETDLGETVTLSDYGFGKAIVLTKFYTIGLAHMIPVFFQILCVILFGYSLWVNVRFNGLQSTAVVLGVIFALILSGGYVQIIGRVGSFYWYAGEKLKSYLVMKRMIWKGIKLILGAAIFSFVLNFFVYLYPYPVVIVAFIYTLLIGILLLLFATMYPINQRWIIIVAVLVGTMVSFYLRFRTQTNIYFTHWIGICVACLITYIGFITVFKKETQSKKTYGELIREEVLVYNNHWFFIYGILLYVHIFLDRFFAWSAVREIVPPFVVYYEQRYEIGMDLSIIVFFLMAGVLEYSITIFSIMIASLGKKVKFSELTVFKNRFRKMYITNVIVLLITTVFAFWFVYAFVEQDWGFRKAFKEEVSVISLYVFKVGSIGYFLLAWAMLNVLYMFRLNKPEYAVNCITLTVVVNFILGITLSRLVGYQYSVYGFLIGSIVFLIMSFVYNLKLFKNIDYYVGI